MKASEMRGLSETELNKRLGDARQELFNLRFQVATRKLENTSRLRTLRKDISRILQVANERRQDEVAGAAAGR